LQQKWPEMVSQMRKSNVTDVGVNKLTL
jgi:hypothetical protein